MFQLIKVSRARRPKLWCTLLLHDEIASFHLVKRLIGKNGMNMRIINGITTCNIRIRGRGSGYLENGKEANVHLQISVSCAGAKSIEFTFGIQLLIFLLGTLNCDLTSFCREKEMTVNNLEIWSYGDMTKEAESLLHHRGLLMLSDERQAARCHQTDYPLRPGLVDSSDTMITPPLRYRYQKGLFCLPQYMTCVAGAAWFPPWMASWAQHHAYVYNATCLYHSQVTSSHSWERDNVSNALAIEDDDAPSLTYKLQQYAESEAGSMLSDDAANRNMHQSVLEYLELQSNTSH